jgi:cell wall-associated NlpC family hydrolase
LSTEPTAAQIVAEARAWLGVPWVHQGRGGLGVDCAGLARVVGQAFGFAMDRPAYHRTGNGEEMMRTLRNEPHIREVPIRPLQPGDLVIMAFDGVPHHIGIVGDHRRGLSLIHADMHRRKVVEHRLDLLTPIAGARLVAAFRLAHL